MYNKISVEEALKLDNSVFIDVRSPLEYEEATIPNSINIPIFSNEEREIIGKVYKANKIEANKLGIKFASAKLEGLYQQVIILKERYKNIVIFCWRGGLRSSSICNILSIFNLKDIYQLKGGYKSYRRKVNNFIENEVSNYKFVVLHGLTGVGKTTILKELNNRNIPIIDFEGIANNAGSVFGSLLFNSNPPSQKNFEAEIFNKLYYNSYGYVVVESESKRIGSVNLPIPILNHMNNGIHILIKTSLENRVNNLYNDYINRQLSSSISLDDLILKALKHLKKRLGNETIDNLILNIKDHNYHFVIEYLINEYYDPLYRYSIDQINNYILQVNYDQIQEAVNEIYNYLVNLEREE